MCVYFFLYMKFTNYYYFLGKKAKPNPNHVPKSNGCGTFGIEVCTLYMFLCFSTHTQGNRRNFLQSQTMEIYFSTF